MSLEFISEMFIPVVLVFCLAVGYILKHWITDLNNKIIPTTLAFLGAVSACVVSKGISFDLIVAGMVTGLASTGLHQAFKQFIEKKE